MADYLNKQAANATAEPVELATPQVLSIPAHPIAKEKDKKKVQDIIPEAPRPALIPDEPPVAVGASMEPADVQIPADEPFDIEKGTRGFLEPRKTRTLLFDKVKSALAAKFPLSNDVHTLELANIRYDRPKEFSLADQKQAILKGRTLDWPLKGTWRLKDKVTGKVLDEQDKVVARVPYFTDRGTIISNGSEYSMSHQQRLRPGIYARKKDNGEMEAYVNAKGGSSFRMFMDPATGVFKIRVGQANLPAIPVMEALGADSEAMKSAWGEEIYNANVESARKIDLNKLYAKFASPGVMKHHPEPKSGIKAVFDRMSVDPDVSERNLGKPYDKITGEALVRVAQKLLHINQGKEEHDDRDSQANQVIVGPEDIYAERITKDPGQILRGLLFKARFAQNLGKISSGILSKQLNAALLGSGLGSALQEINPIEVMDQQTKISRMGTGGIPSMDSVPDEARNVLPTQFGLIDPVRTPESDRIGVETRIAHNVLKGADGQLYRPVLDVKSGKEIKVSGRQLVHSIVAFPGEMETENKKVRAMENGRIKYVDRSKVDFAMPKPDDMFNPLSLLIPGFSGVKGQRLIMGTRMLTQALPIKDAEAPLVQAGVTGEPGNSYEAKFGKFAGAIRVDDKDTGGVVTKITEDGITIKDPAGKTKTYDLFNNFPHNRKTLLHNTPVVRLGQEVKPGDLLAHSNYTDKEGKIALGKNLRVAYLPVQDNYEDAIVISQSAAHKLTSEHMYQHKLDATDRDLELGLSRYMAQYPGKFNRDQFATMDENGVVKPGTTVHYGDPLILAVGKKTPPKGMTIGRAQQTWYNDRAITWEHHNEGVVTDVHRGHDGINVTIKGYAPAEEADKIAARWANKGVIGRVMPDDQMPKDKDGNPFEVILNPLGLISRVNPTMIAETVLAKIARKTGKPYYLEPFPKENIARFALQELARHGMSDTEDVYDPVTNRTLKNVLTGEQHIMKLQHTSESKVSARDTAGYTMEGLPAKGGYAGSKRIGGLDTLALMSHGVPAILRDARLIRGQANPDYWRNMRMGLPAAPPRESQMFEKFKHMLRGAGISVSESRDRLHLSAMTDKQVDELAGERELKNADAIDMRDDSPIEGGLFDPNLTGGRDGNRYTKITLAEPMPNPVMEEPIRRVLGLTKPKFQDLLTSPDGPNEILRRLQKVDVDEGIRQARETIKSGKMSKRDDAVKILRFLDSAKNTGLTPADWMITKVPVIPPKFRPAVKAGNMQLTSDSNLLYKDLFEANKTLRELKKITPDVGADRLTTYNALKAVTGLGDPISPKLQEKNVAGLLTHIFGKGSPKFGAFQRKVISNTVDSVARSVVTPDMNLDIDQVGLPEQLAWDVYKPYVMRRLARAYNTGNGGGIPLVELAKWIENKDPRAKKALDDELKVRPVMYSRAPSWHRYNLLGAWPVIVPGHTMRISPPNTPGMAADFDGDQMNFHVPSSDDAVKEVIEKLMPSKNLLGTNDYDVRLTPTQEFLMGLYSATRAPAKGKTPRVFKDRQTALQALRRGEIGVNDPVQIAG